jgi:hypothetical protein
VSSCGEEERGRWGERRRERRGGERSASARVLRVQTADTLRHEKGVGMYREAQQQARLADAGVTDQLLGEEGGEGEGEGGGK